MAEMNFGGVIENVVTREEFPLEKAREVLKNETIAVIGYGVQGPGQSMNLRDNGFNVIVGQRQGKTFEKAIADGWVPGETLFSIEEACKRATIIQLLLSDAAQIECWPTIKKYLTPGKTLYFYHGFAITCTDRTGKDLFNGAADKVVVTERRIVELRLAHSTAGGLVIKEIYTGGCSKAPQEGTYQSDQYFIIHNNDFETVYLDSLCFGTLSPFNSTAVNHWTERDPVTGETVFPDFAPVSTVVWQLPGGGKDFPLAPGADAVVALRGAIDHTIQYPLSVNLNRPDLFVCYNPTYFPNPTYHPAPGDLVKPERYAQVVIKTGQSNANTVSISSPTLVLFRTPMPAGEYVLEPDVVRVTPGSSADRVVVVPYAWIVDAVEVFDGRSSSNG